MFEIKHLNTLVALKNHGNIRKAAESLFTSQSALSHQIKEFEQRLGSPLFIRNSSPIEFTSPGEKLLILAQEILPKIEQTNKILTTRNKHYSLNIAIACHACFQWLLPINKKLKQPCKNIDIEFVDSTFDNEKKQTADLLFTDEKNNEPGVIYQKIGKFEVLAVFSEQHKLKDSTFIEADEFINKTLLTYPIPIEELDIFNLFLNKFNIQPAKIKQVNNSHVMLQMVAANMGVATLPDWLLSSLSIQATIQTKRLGEKGVFKHLYARYQENSECIALIEEYIPLTISAFNHMYLKQEKTKAVQ